MIRECNVMKSMYKYLRSKHKRVYRVFSSYAKSLIVALVVRVILY